MEDEQTGTALYMQLAVQDSGSLITVSSLRGWGGAFGLYRGAAGMQNGPWLPKLAVPGVPSHHRSQTSRLPQKSAIPSACLPGQVPSIEGAGPGPSPGESSTGPA